MVYIRLHCSMWKLQKSLMMLLSGRWYAEFQPSEEFPCRHGLGAANKALAMVGLLGQFLDDNRIRRKISRTREFQFAVYCVTGFRP